MFVFMYVYFFPPVSIHYPNYGVLGFQPQSVYIPDLDSMHLPRYIFNTPYVEHARYETNKQTKERNKMGTSISLQCGKISMIGFLINLGSYVLQLLSNPNEVLTTITLDEWYE